MSDIGDSFIFAAMSKAWQDEERKEQQAKEKAVSKIPTLEECEIVAGSFRPMGDAMRAKGLEGEEFVVADSMTYQDCRLVAHRCNTFDELLASLERLAAYAGACKGGCDHPDCAEVRHAVVAIAKAKGTTP